MPQSKTPSNKRPATRASKRASNPPAKDNAAEAVIRVLLERFGWDTGALWLTDRDIGGLRRQASLWLHPPPRSALDRVSGYAVAMPGVGVLSRVLETGEPQWLPDLETIPGFVRITEAIADGLRSLLIVPVAREGRTVGVIELLSKQVRVKDEAAAAATHELAQRLFQTGGAAWTYVEGGSLRRLVEDIADIAVVIDPQGVILYESRAVTEILGYTLDQRIGHNVFEFIHPEDAAVAAKVIQAGFQDPGSVHKVEVRARHKNGSWRWLESVGRVESDDAGGFVVIATSRDITDVKVAQEALLQRDQRLETLNAIAKELLAGKTMPEIIDRTILHLSRLHPTLRSTYWTVADDGSMTVTHSKQPREMLDITGLMVDLTPAPDFVQALRTGRTIVVEDALSDSRVAHLADAFATAGSAAIASVAIKQSRGLLGVLGFASPTPRQWSEHEVATLQEVAAMISIALREAQHAGLRRMAEKNLRRAASELNTIFEAFPELGRTVNGGGKTQPKPEPRTRSTTPAQPRLSAQDLLVLKHVAQGLTNREIAERLHLSPYTVKDHMKAVMGKLQAKNRAEAVVIATKRGLV
jgi:PAS domain S-box-containing protein